MEETILKRLTINKNLTRQQFIEGLENGTISDDDLSFVDDTSGSVDIDVDTEMSDTSENPVQNKVIKAYIDSTEQDIISNYMEVDSELQQQINAQATAVTELQDDVMANMTEIADLKGSALTNIAIGEGALTILGTASEEMNATNIGTGSTAAKNGTAVGSNSHANTSSTAIGRNSKAYGEGATAIGFGSEARGKNSIVLGIGATTETDVFKVALPTSSAKATDEASGLFTMLTSDGKIPDARVNLPTITYHEEQLCQQESLKII